MLLPTQHITNKQQEILLLLYRFRFLTRIHLQILLHHKDERRINQWLLDLTNTEYTGKIENTQSKVNTVPNIYYLSSNGIRFLRTQQSCQKEYIERLYTEHKKSEPFISRCLFIADIYCQLFKQYETNPDFVFYTQSDYTVGGIIKEIFSQFVYRRDKEKPYYIGEIFGEKTPRFAIRARIDRYVNFFTRGDWIKNEQSPKVLYICPNNKIENYVYKYTKKNLNEEDINLNIYVSTHNEVKEYSIEGKIWKSVL